MDKYLMEFYRDKMDLKIVLLILALVLLIAMMTLFFLHALYQKKSSALRQAFQEKEKQTENQCREAERQAAVWKEKFTALKELAEGEKMELQKIREEHITLTA